MRRVKPRPSLNITRAVTTAPPGADLVSVAAHATFKSPLGHLRSPIKLDTGRSPSFCSPIFHSSILSPVSSPMQAEPSVIVPGLYLGSHNHGNNPELLGQMGITHVVDCCCLPKSRVDSITYLDLDLDDHVDFKISNYFDRACKFMEQALDAGGNVLVHCQMGRSRSVTIVVAFLMYKFPRFRNFQDALSFITSQHPVSDPNFSFIDQLRHWGSDQSRGPRIFPDSPY